MSITFDEPCPYCEDGYIQHISYNEFDGPGNPSSRWFECDYCHGTGLLTKDYPEQDEVSEEGRGKI